MNHVFVGLKSRRSAAYQYCTKSSKSKKLSSIALTTSSSRDSRVSCYVRFGGVKSEQLHCLLVLH